MTEKKGKKAKQESKVEDSIVNENAIAKEMQK